MAQSCFVVCSRRVSTHDAFDLGTYPIQSPYGMWRANTPWGLVQLVLSVVPGVIAEIARGVDTEARSAADRALAAHDG